MTIRSVRGVAAWVYGLAISIVLIGTWGRAIVADADGLGAALSPLGRTETIVSTVSGWIVGEVVDSGVARPVAEETVQRAMSTTAMGRAMEELVAEMVRAAALGGVVVDVARILEPATPEIAAAMISAGVPTTEPEVSRAVAALDPVVVLEPGTRPLVGPDSLAATRLGTAALVGAAVMMASGAIYVAASPDRHAAVRSLLLRLGLSALSFAIILRLGGWLVDSEGGRAPITETVAALAHAKWGLPLALGSLACAGAAATWVWRRVRPAEASPAEA